MTLVKWGKRAALGLIGFAFIVFGGLWVFDYLTRFDAPEFASIYDATQPAQIPQKEKIVFNPNRAVGRFACAHSLFPMMPIQ